MKKKSIIKKIIITIVIIVVLFFAFILYMVYKDLQQEAILKQEIINYSNKDLAKDNYTINVKTNGDCAYIEEAVKKYYKELSDNIKAISSYLNDDKLTKVLSVENLVTDRPDFTISHTTVENSRSKINKAIENINNLCDEKTIKNLIDKDKLDDGEYYYDLYLQLMYTKQDLEDFANVKKEMETLSTNLNDYLDKVDEILNFLEVNDKLIQYSSNVLYFNSDTALNEYKKLISELDTIANKSDTSTNSSSDNSNDEI